MSCPVVETRDHGDVDVGLRALIDARHHHRVHPAVVVTDEANPGLVDIRLRKKEIHAAAQRDHLFDRVRIVLFGHTFAEPVRVDRGGPHRVDEYGDDALRGELHRLVQELRAVRGLGFAEPVDPQNRGKGTLALGRHDVSRDVLPHKGIERDVANGDALTFLDALQGDARRNGRVVVEEGALRDEVVGLAGRGRGEESGENESGGEGRVFHDGQVSLRWRDPTPRQSHCQGFSSASASTFRAWVQPFGRRPFQASASRGRRVPRAGSR